MSKSATVYCYHCRVSHPREDMRLVVSKTGKRWRCLQSIEAAKSSKNEREAFGRQISEANKSEAQKQQRRLIESVQNTSHLTKVSE